ncbi:MAG TPA: methyltransferase domain-containing protein [Bryobacteraceae bacterium]|jgi:SAM-dependent methyltransferase|nr:methyltransferase domain-containing protein [Bryobacteraceae bacterium]
MTSLLDFYDPHLYDLGAGDADVDGTLGYYLAKVGPVPQQILDIGAGTGRFAIPLATAGHAVLAIDRSERMLAALERHARMSLPANTIRIECRQFGPRQHEGPMDVALATDDFLLHLLSSEELTEFFRNLASWLRPGGRFLTDIRSRKMADLKAARPPFILRSCQLVRDESRDGSVSYVNVTYWEAYDEKTQVLETTCQYQILDALGEVTRSYFRILRQRLHKSADIREAAVLAGFTLVKHTERNGTADALECDLGGSFEFRY